MKFDEAMTKMLGFKTIRRSGHDSVWVQLVGNVPVQVDIATGTASNFAPSGHDMICEDWEVVDGGR